MKIGFIGCGNMAGAIIRGIIDSKAVDAGNVFVYDPTTEKLNELAENYKINKCADEVETARNADYLLLGVKPNILSEVLEKIDSALNEKSTVLISIAAGKSIEFISKYLSQNNKIIRVMPNINAKVCAACSAYCTNESVSDKDKDFIEKIFGAVGTITELTESSFPLFGVIAGCAPAFSYMFIDAIARAAVKNGMSKETALTFAAQTVLGSAKMVLESKTHPYELTDKVCSPGGTTIEGVLSLQADGFEGAVHKAVQASLDKDRKI
ncbi:MAG: pyrroline-5-carboxylate reductase [Clostridiales bacterium]|nr:pyrroline-5-carboxylate reductase [Clostridiales bacterium]